MIRLPPRVCNRQTWRKTGEMAELNGHRHRHSIRGLVALATQETLLDVRKLRNGPLPRLADPVIFALWP